MVDGIEEVLNFFSGTFGLPSEWFEGTNFVFYFVIPVIAMTFFWYFLLNNKLRLLKNSGANFGISILITLMSTPVFNFTGHPTGTMIIAIVGAIMFEGSLTLKRILVALIVAALVGWGFPYLINLVSTQV